MCNLEEKCNYCLLLPERVFVARNREGVGIDGSDSGVLDAGLLGEGDGDEVGEVGSGIADGADDDEIGEGIRWDGDGGGVLDVGQAGKGECDRDGEVIYGDWEVEIRRGRMMG